MSVETALEQMLRMLHRRALKLAALPEDGLPAISLVFVQSQDGNTAVDNPGDLGGGD